MSRAKCRRDVGSTKVVILNFVTATDVMVSDGQGGGGQDVASYCGPGHRLAARRHAAELRAAMRFDGRKGGG